ncbi:hypothetical protein P5P81_07055 [Tritonibacter mobilis]|nr:hypothetical protein [Tritonibacter mobilis]
MRTFRKHIKYTAQQNCASNLLRCGKKLKFRPQMPEIGPRGGLRFTAGTQHQMLQEMKSTGCEIWLFCDISTADTAKIPDKIDKLTVVAGDLAAK